MSKGLSDEIRLEKSDWADMSGRDHFVQFYTDDDKIVDAVAAYLDYGLRFDEICIIAATGNHNRAIEQKMRVLGSGVDAALAEQRFIILDAQDTLAKFMQGGEPDKALFEKVIGGLIRRAAGGKKRVRVFGEMVAVLAENGNPAAAVALERLWNDLAKTLQFRLFCAYPGHSLSHPLVASHASDICSTHCHVLGREEVGIA